MDNYAILLQEFHRHELQQTSTRQVQNMRQIQFIQIIDQIRNTKKSKIVLLGRKRQQKNKVKQKMERSQEKIDTSRCKTSIDTMGFSEGRCLQQINQLTLKKELDQIEKQLCSMKKKIKQIQSQISVYARKENEIEQLKYSSKRELECAQLEVKNQKILNQQLEQKNERVLEQLASQRENLQHENRYLADKLNEKKRGTKKFNDTFSISINGNMRINFMTEGNCSNVEPVKIEQIYTKKILEQHLRTFYILLSLKNSWKNEEILQSLNTIRLKAETQLKAITQFLFYSKAEILDYYMEKLKINNFEEISKLIIQAYQTIMKNIGKAENKGNILNVKVRELKDEVNQAQNLRSRLEMLTVEDVVAFISEFQGEINKRKVEVCFKSRQIFRVLQNQFKLTDKLRRLNDTLENIIRPKKQNYERKISNSSQLNKKLQIPLNLCVNKQKRVSTTNLISQSNISFTELNCSNQNLSLSKSSAGTLSTKNPFACKKSSRQLMPAAQTTALLFQFAERKSNPLCCYEQILYRNPKVVIFYWNEAIKNGTDGAKLLETILHNDLYRAFYAPSDYNPNLSEIQNETVCVEKVYQEVMNMLQILKTNISNYIKKAQQGCQNLMEANKLLPFYKASPNSQPRFVIESKGYYRRDNFKLLQKLQLMQLKKKGLYIPFQYGIDIENELINTSKKQIKLDESEELRNLQSRMSRKTVPYGANYISTYREKLGKADRKIRDLLRNADTLRIRKKTAKEFLSTTKRTIQANFINS